MAGGKAVVVGGLGVIGRNLVDHLLPPDEWEIVGVSRRAPDFESRAEFVSVDLLERDQAEARRAHLDDVSHVFYSAFQARRPTWPC